MDLLLLLMILGDGIGGILCMRARKYKHVLALGGGVVPAALIFAGVMFASLKEREATGLALPREQLIVAYGAIGLAFASVIWMVLAGITGIVERRHLRWEEPNER